MNILLTTALMVASGPLASADVANRVLGSDHAPARSPIKDSIIAKNGTKKLGAKHSSITI
jgi:hypothetical protein